MEAWREELYHHGILGMKWGVRRYQNKDGSLTSAGAKRYRGEKSLDRKIAKAERSRDAILNARSKNRARIEAIYDKKIAKSQEDLRSYDPIREGLKDKKGKDILTKEDVSEMTKALEDRISKLQVKKREKIKDFDEGTKYVKAGEQHYVDVIKQYKDVKVAAFEDSVYKQSEEYKNAVKAYTNQVLLDTTALGGSAYTKLGYAYDYANGTYAYRTKPKS